MNCSDFLSHYSAFRDRVSADPELLLALESHLADCPTCNRYHNSVNRGVELLRFQDAVEPSPDFRRRLRGRIAESRVYETVMPGSASVAAALMFASALALGGYEVSQRQVRHKVVVAVHTPQPPARMPYAATPRPLSESDFTLAAFKHHPQRPAVQVLERSPVALGAWTSLPH